MHQLSIFQNISQADLERMYHCFGMRKQKFFPGSRILSYAPDMNNVCVLLNGKAHLYCTDEDGNFSLLEQLKPNDVFGEMFYLPMVSLEYTVEADTECEVMFIHYDKIIHPCHNTCQHHSQRYGDGFPKGIHRSGAAADAGHH